MTPDEIRAKRQEIQDRLRANEAAAIAIRGEWEALRHLCRHPKLRKWTSYDYGGGSDAREACDDCGHTR